MINPAWDDEHKKQRAALVAIANSFKRDEESQGVYADSYNSATVLRMANKIRELQLQVQLQLGEPTPAPQTAQADLLRRIENALAHSRAADGVPCSPAAFLRTALRAVLEILKRDAGGSQ